MIDYRLYLDELYKIDNDFSEIYVLDEKSKSLPKTIKINTSTRIFNGKQYDDLFIIEPKVAYLMPLPSKLNLNKQHIRNFIGETGIVLQLLENHILLYNTNENLIFLNKGIPICGFFRDIVY